MEHPTDVPSDDSQAAAEGTEATPARRRKSWIIGSTTLACAVGGALMGAFAFSAFPASVPGAGSATDRLTTSSTKTPGDTGSLCGSTRNTATSADTALSCENFGVSSFAARMAHEMRESAASAGGGMSAAQQASSHRSAKGSAADHGKKAGSSPVSLPSAPSAPGLPAPTGSKTKSTCVSTPAAPKGTPSLPGGGSGSISVSGSGGKITVKAGAKGVKLCGKAPTAPKAPKGLPAPTLPGVAGTGTSTSKSQHHKRHKSGLQGIVNGVTGGIGL